MQGQNAPINFLELSESYRTKTPPHIRVRRHMLVQHMNEDYFLVGRRATDEIIQFMEARGWPVGRSMLHQDSMMYHAVLGYLKGDHPDIDERFHRVLIRLAESGIIS